MFCGTVITQELEAVTLSLLRLRPRILRRYRSSWRRCPVCKLRWAEFCRACTAATEAAGAAALAGGCGAAGGGPKAASAFLLESKRRRTCVAMAKPWRRWAKCLRLATCVEPCVFYHRDASRIPKDFPGKVAPGNLNPSRTVFFISRVINSLRIPKDFQGKVAPGNLNQSDWFPE